ncbi:ModD protein [Rhodoblastus sphagnicola]|uniref:Putative pyrophosphorylase ModD n=1 Tax=Rhodoblastus sphagnicola TaxID=333368 RepID=A0A2S6N9Y6_9HYPH|nr:ModD protein [Rhodoblastus sphagnicola]MBB4198777.1 molybdenum transport protein [Rhodoblastus sphagnicola]PPQ31411.1 ModD protein [Rhodoblastus sphagnicola]
MVSFFDSDLERLLADDVPHGDLTTDQLGLAGASGRMDFRARGPMVAALVEASARLLEIAGARVTLSARSGDPLAAGAEILSAQGPAPALLRGWKVAQTLIEIWAGVASAARDIVEEARAAAPDICVACTRKNTPGTKKFAIAAVEAGGAAMHRLGLSETILVFPEHLAFLPGVTLVEVATRLRRRAPEKKLALEAKNLDEALAAARAGFDLIQAEKFSLADISRLAEALRDLPNRPLLAAAGGVKRDNARAYAEAGADILVTSSPYSAPPKDVAVTFVADCQDFRQSC